MTRLRDLDARFVRYEVRTESYRRIKSEAFAAHRDPYTEDEIETMVGPQIYFVTVDTLAEADGVMYLCPKCFAANRGPVGTHSVLNWFVGKVPDDIDPKPGRWIPSGTGLDDLTFVGPAAASVLLTSGCGWHGFVRNGDAA